ncbi:MAG TPA: biotin/lipoyl-binding protein, partial [Bryobacterales bacterium]|nr:biotin/lipoyl-binding protein [Bryobacterales bacterium]
MEPRARQLLERSEPQTPPAPRQPPKTTAKPRRGVAWLLLLAVAAAAYAGFQYYRTAQGKKQAAAAALAARAAARAVPVAAVPARAGDMPVYLRGLGNVTAFNSVTVRTRVDGQLMSVDFQEGQHVNKGDLLAEIDPRPFQVQLEQAEG